MGMLEGTIRLEHRTSQHWLARFACAIVITLVVAACSYAVTYRALVVISTPSGAASIVPAKPYPVTPSTGKPVASLPGH